jgi:hypothetical protein
MSASADEYDRRQLVLIREHLETFRSGVTDLSALISGLAALGELLTTCSRDWSDRFEAAWRAMDAIHAYAVAYEEPLEPLRQHPVVLQKVDEIEALVEQCVR